ncbi:hypothetical protein [Prauserella flavalba]|uniref:hypothetical protein n=1 Tax=Prauserella flavalba TaxID=1477506 RepID=UPI00143D9A6D|nr:hypothetical protein [Prauserella flavalba]
MSANAQLAVRNAQLAVLSGRLADQPTIMTWQANRGRSIVYPDGLTLLAAV